MSKPVKPRASEPYARTPSSGPPPPPNNRKSSQPAAVPKFYDGPTVSAKANEVKAQAKQVAKTTVAETRIQARNAVATARRHPWSLISILTTIPFLLFMSLFSTVVCPPPSLAPSPVSKFILTPLGLERPHSSLHQTLCYPANVYYRDVLEPYVYPVIDDVQARAMAHPLYVKGVEPSYRAARDTTTRVWEGPVRPVVDRIWRGARRIYLTFVDPHIPYLRARFHTLTAPYNTRAAALYSKNVAPHLATANAYAQAAGKRSVDTYSYVAAHPLTGQASKYADAGLQMGRKRGYAAYLAARPHVIRAGRGAERIAKEVLGPRAAAGIEYAGEQVAQGWAVLKARIVGLYNAHLDPVIGHHIQTASKAVSPCTSTFHKMVYLPYILPALEYIVPPALLAPEPPKSFWAMMADILPSPGQHAAEQKGKMDDFYEKVEKAKKPSEVPVPKADIKKEAKGGKSKEEKKMDKKEMDRVIEGLKTRVDAEGNKGYLKLRSELLKQNTDTLGPEGAFTKLSASAKHEVDREAEYILGGLDKLYTQSTSLTKEQVQASSETAEKRMSTTIGKIKERVAKQQQRWFDDGKPLVKAVMQGVDAALGKEYSDLKDKMGWMDGVTYNDWQKYHGLKDSVDEWHAKYAALHRLDTKEKSLIAPSANINKAVATLNTELDDRFEGFRDRINTLRRAANARIDARAAVSPSSSKSPSPAKGKATILPVAQAAEAGGAIIGKAKEQVEDALNQARGITTESGIKATASELLDSASSAVHDATRSAMKAVGATPSPEGVAEHAQSVYDAARSGAEDAYDAASSVVHDATRSAMRAVGATPSPESLGEHAESLSGAVAESAASAYEAASSGAGSLADQASSVVHDATRSAMSAVGATPSPENAQEHLESIANVVAQGYASVAGVVGDNVASASSAVHDATRSGMRAVGVTPTPETPGEYAESVYDAASSGASSAYEAVSDQAALLATSIQSALGLVSTPEPLASTASSYLASVASAGSSVGAEALASGSSILSSLQSEASVSVASATDVAGNVAAQATDQAALLATSIQSALGLVSTPEPLASSASSYLASMASAGSSAGSEALASGSSLLASLQSEASVSVHSATRAAQKAVGATPSPETPGEYLEKAKAVLREL